MKQLLRRAYQVRAANYVVKSKQRRLLVVSPGGSGKTAIITFCARAFNKQRKRTLVLSHRKEIIEQTLRMLEGRVRAGAVMAGIKGDAEAPVQVASIDTFRKRIWPAVDVVIVDEAHRSATATYRKVLTHYAAKGTRIIGFTASPVRLDGVGMNEMYDDMYEVVKPSQILGKYIMKPRVYSAQKEHLPNLLGVAVTRQEFVRLDLVKRVNKDGLVGGIVEHALKHLKGRTAVAFCVSVPHSRHVAAKLTAAGIKTLHVDGMMKAVERSEILRKLTEGEIQAVSCCMILSEGWDLPSCEAVILARPTRSLSLFLQMCNRAARMSKRTPIILDHACNHLLHGYSYIDRTWSLQGEERALGDESTEGRVRVCPECLCINEPMADCCEECGCDFDKAKPSLKMLKERKELELAEYVETRWKPHEERVIAFAKQKGWSKKWASAVLAEWKNAER